MTPETAILLTMLTPLVGTILIVLNGRQPNMREVMTLMTAGTLFFVVLSLTPGVLAGERPEVFLFEVLPGLAVAFKVEPLGLLFGLLASALWIMTSLYSIGYMRGTKESNQTRYYAYFAIALASTMGVAFAGNMFTLFIFYEVLTLCTYPLVTHKGTPEAKRGGRIYLGFLLSTSIGLQLLAIIWTWNVTGTLDFTHGGILQGRVNDTVAAILLLLYMFGIGKAALMPLHRWLPAAMVAPTPVSALLHAVAVVKAGVFTVLKVVVYIFGIDYLTATGANKILMVIAGATLLIASLVALTRNNLKARLAYSTVSQLSYIVLGAAMANSWGIIGGGMHIVMHAFGKITLFFCAGAIYVATRKTEVSQLIGIGRQMPVTMTAFFIGALSIIGLPPLGGSWSKWYLAMAAVEAEQLVFVAILMISSLLNIAYLMPIVARAFFLPLPKNERRVKRREAPLLCVLPLCLTAIGSLLLFFFADFIYRLLAPIAFP